MTAYINILIIAVSLALDAVSVSVASGVKAKHATIRDALKIAFFFGVFQAVMPLIGWGIGTLFEDIIASYSNWIAFILLTLVGFNMIHDALKNEEEHQKNILNTKILLALAVATSIDALVVGVTLDLIDVPLLLSVGIIGVVTFILSFLGFLFGKKLGTFFQGKVEVIGGVALIAIGVKMLLS